MVDAIPLTDDRKKLLNEMSEKIVKFYDDAFSKCKLDKKNVKRLAKIFIPMCKFVPGIEEMEKEIPKPVLNNIIKVISRLVADCMWRLMEIMIDLVLKDEILYKNRALISKVSAIRSDKMLADTLQTGFLIIGNTDPGLPQEYEDEIKNHTNDPIVIEHFKKFSKDFKEEMERIFSEATNDLKSLVPASDEDDEEDKYEDDDDGD